MLKDFLQDSPRGTVKTKDNAAIRERMQQNRYDMEEMRRKNVTPQRRARIVEVLSMRRRDLTVVLANIHDQHNVSAV